MVVKPYQEQILNENTRIRTFAQDVDGEELCWHRDHNTRMVEVISGENWKIQLDNSLPVVLECNQVYRIPKAMYHRLIKGSGDLTVKIVEEI